MCHSSPERERDRLHGQGATGKLGQSLDLHRIGCNAAESLERARLSIGESLRANRSDILFGSGATESAHLALLGLAKPNHQDDW